MFFESSHRAHSTTMTPMQNLELYLLPGRFWTKFWRIHPVEMLFLGDGPELGMPLAQNWASQIQRLADRIPMTLNRARVNVVGTCS